MHKLKNVNMQSRLKPVVMRKVMKKDSKPTYFELYKERQKMEKAFEKIKGRRVKQFSLMYSYFRNKVSYVTVTKIECQRHSEVHTYHVDVERDSY